MTRVYAVVEGASEKGFLKDMIAPHLARRGVYLTPMQVLRKGGRGGGSRWQPWFRHVSRLLKQYRGLDVRVTTMLDLYAIPRDSPGWTEPGSTSGEERAAAIEKAMAESLSDRRFIPYVQVFEFEAFLFADLSALRREAPDIIDRKLFSTLTADTKDMAPETIDDGPCTAPSKRIEQCTRGFRKTIHGLQAIAVIGLPRLREACPRFHEWLGLLELLGEGD